MIRLSILKYNNFIFNSNQKRKKQKFKLNYIWVK